jgi:nucleoside-diphosphate-sugar epimerase
MKAKTKVLITGASGFVGRYVVSEFESSNETFVIYVLVRKITAEIKNVIQVLCDDITNIESASIPWPEIDVVIHLAARAHVLKESVSNPLADFRRINRDATKKIASIAAAHEVKRFVFLSSIGVLGNASGLKPFSEESAENPHADYAVSKLEAEQEIKKICANTNMEYVIVRPPLVIGIDAPGNFQLLLKLVLKRIPLPLLLVKNRRSFVFCKNLARFIFVCAAHSDARNQLFLIADEPAMSTSELIRELSNGYGFAPYLFPVPRWALKFFATVFSRKNTYVQLCESLEVDSSKAKLVLGWQSPYEFKEAIRHIFNK